MQDQVLDPTLTAPSRSDQAHWQTLCSLEDLSPNAGICAKVGHAQVAIFYCRRSNNLYALCNKDPIADAYVLSRGIIGSIDGQPYVASPLYKQHFHLKTGACLEDKTIQVRTFTLRTDKDLVQILIPNDENTHSIKE